MAETKQVAVQGAEKSPKAGGHRQKGQGLEEIVVARTTVQTDEETRERSERPVVYKTGGTWIAL